MTRPPSRFPAGTTNHRPLLQSLSLPSLSIPFPILLLLVFAAGLSRQQNDPVSGFCRRFAHQTAIVDDKLYIDGGFINYNPLEQFPENYTNDYLFFHDLSTVADSGMPQLYANLSKNRTVPSLHGGVLWGDPVNKRLYQFGGEFYRELTTAFRGIYAYDILADAWDFLSVDHARQPASTLVRRASYGAGVAVPDRGEGYYYGGWLSNRSEPGWGPDSIADSYLVNMLYIPAGDAGMLVYLGGVRDAYGNGSVIEGQPMEEILLYDVLSFKWYKQKASGVVPAMRSRFCAGVAWPEDRSSYNIYLYGGAGMAPSTAGFDDVYVLSLPSFTWIKLYPNDTDSDTTGDYPHHSLSCNMHLDGAQMLIIGGTFPTSAMCDTPEQGYQVPFDVWNVVGGGAKGGPITLREPEAGFGSPDLRILLSRTASAAVRTPTRDVGGDDDDGDRKPLSAGAIAGIVVGAVVALALIALGAFCLFRKKRRAGAGADPRRPEMASHANHHHHPSLHGGAHPHHLGAGYPSSTSYYPLPIELADSSPHPAPPPPSHAHAAAGAPGAHGLPGAYDIGTVTATPDSAHAKLDHGRWTPADDAGTNPRTIPGTNTGNTMGSGFSGGGGGGGGGGTLGSHSPSQQQLHPQYQPQELSTTPGMERRAGREPVRLHETYYHA
ncbi:unnamed protein product [Parascedosporium putredinis]|uniref:Kelch repeat-containing protein n=1 Tax=Parascedosporium putredinis TaxID=1442378 RepID=A0A9P1GWE7_9PEZI|nr:unnamed protein product [Parascedosporium putredinis]CAI7988677.1 unnamed protein product [Parascedosporium putredinis]